MTPKPAGASPQPRLRLAIDPSLETQCYRTLGDNYVTIGAIPRSSLPSALAVVVATLAAGGGRWAYSPQGQHRSPKPTHRRQGVADLVAFTFSIFLVDSRHRRLLCRPVVSGRHYASGSCPFPQAHRIGRCPHRHGRRPQPPPRPGAPLGTIGSPPRPRPSHGTVTVFVDASQIPAALILTMFLPCDLGARS